MLPRESSKQVHTSKYTLREVMFVSINMSRKKQSVSRKKWMTAYNNQRLESWEGGPRSKPQGFSTLALRTLLGQVNLWAGT